MARMKKFTNKEDIGLLFVLPFLIFFVISIIAPLAYSGYLSFFKKRLIGGNSFVGFTNYVQAIQDAEFWLGLKRVGLFFLMQVPIMLILALVFALIIDSGKIRFSKFIRILIFVPYAVPAVVATLMWGYLYGPNYGLFAQLSEYLHTPRIQFFSEALALPSIANIVTWEFVGYNMVILYAAIKSFSTELYEAAAVDGAGSWRIAWSIKVPQLRPAIFLCLIFSVIGSFQLYVEPAQMINLAPTVINNTYTPNLYAYNQAFVSQDINYAAAVSFMLGLAVFLMSILVSFMASRAQQYEKRVK
jgi:multiple sugar transport system permease protein